MFLTFILIVFAALVLPVLSCLVILQAQKEGRSIVGAIAAVASVWTMSSAVAPALRSIIFAVGSSPYWSWASIAMLCLAIMVMMLVVPQWIANSRPWIGESVSSTGRWLAFVSRVAAGVVLVLCLFSFQVVFARLVVELASSGLILYLVLPDKNPGLSLDTLLHTATISMSAFAESPGQVVEDAIKLPNLAFSMLVQAVALAINLASVLSVVPELDRNNSR